MNADYLWELDTDAHADVLEETGATERSEDRLWSSFTRLVTCIEQLVQGKDKLVEPLNRAYNEVGHREVWESDSHLFFTSGFESLILQRPDGYVMELSMVDPVNVLDRMRSARSIDVMCQLFGELTSLT